MSCDYIITMSPMEGIHLEHKRYKYISRKWKNGRWVYTYPKVSNGFYIMDKQISKAAGQDF